MTRGRRLGFALALAGAAWLAAAGCGRERPEAAKEEGARAAALPPPPPRSERGVIRGVVRFEGDVPEPARLSVRGDAECVAAHPDGLLDDSFVAGTLGGLANAIVHVAEGASTHAWPVPDEPAVLDQAGCRYLPRVLGVQVGQTLRILNSDRTFHNVHSVSDRRNAFNVGMPSHARPIDRVLTRPEVMVQLKCDRHPWMTGWIGVLPHPFFAVTGDDGRFTLDGVPAGELVVEAWHEKLGRRRATVQVEPGATVAVEFSFKAPD